MAACDQCTQGYVLQGEPEGTMVNGAYFHPAPTTTDSDSPSTRAVVLLTDIFGLPLKNSKLIADELSKRLQCDVWVPDLFAGKPPVTVDELEPLIPQKPGETFTFTAKLRFLWLFITNLFKFLNIKASVVDPRAIEFVKKLKEEKKYPKLGAVGYCFGGSMAIRLGSQDLFDSVVIAHPGGCSPEEIKAIRVPASWECAEDDQSFKKEVRDNAEAIFAARKGKPEFIEYEFKDYKGTVHGFAARPNMAMPEVVEAYKGALQQTVDWFNKTL
ncbi:dienelactone hydrolase endo-1-3,1,4-beta-D-glucanase [Irpex rosettiformis]|uniref:Dienelactone hydrolase endo-1-3,1,4-beta-D-glucanase n=1 Tax=Irpex rosettiformis TaxID=378272 RepID=A0ACB8TX10_9APHY|nr:dienelactone hydrolase endo-1-3,1,4-beta-D-glucanase [Irpex rosettiformis]